MTRHEHRHNCAHRVRFALTCVAYDRLLERADDRCEICRISRDGATDRGWYLGGDHDHKVGWFAIRGLLCQGCNGAMQSVDSGRHPATDAESDYLAHPFWRSLSMDDFTEKGREDLTESLFWAWLDSHGTDIESMVASTNGLRAVSVGGKTRP